MVSILNYRCSSSHETLFVALILHAAFKLHDKDSIEIHSRQSPFDRVLGNDVRYSFSVEERRATSRQR